MIRSENHYHRHSNNNGSSIGLVDNHDNDARDGLWRLIFWNGTYLKWFFHSTSEMVVGLSFLAHYLRRMERELSSRRFLVWLFTVEVFYSVLQIVALVSLDYDVAAAFVWDSSAVGGPYLIAGGVLYWYWMYIPRLHPRFLSLTMLGMSFSEKSFGYLWAVYVLSMRGTPSILVGAVGMAASALFFFLLLLPGNNGATSLFSMDVPNFIVNMFPWDSIGNLLMLDDSPKVYAPLLVVNTPGTNGGPGLAGFGGMGGNLGARRQHRQTGATRVAPVAAPPPPSPEAIAQLTAMGFQEQQVKDALIASGNNVERAADRLLAG
jgi:hypothetical protein